MINISIPITWLGRGVLRFRHWYIIPATLHAP
jgi:hypothetical protein